MVAPTVVERSKRATLYIAKMTESVIELMISLMHFLLTPSPWQVSAKWKGRNVEIFRNISWLTMTDRRSVMMKAFDGSLNSGFGASCSIFF